MLYLYISIAFVVLAAAGFGISRLWRWVNFQINVLYHALEIIQGEIHERVDGLEKDAKADLNSLKAHTSQIVGAAHADVQRVEQLFKDHAKAVQEDTNRLATEARQYRDEAVTRVGRLATRVERL